MSRFVYLIVSHTAPGQVARLAGAIRKCSPRAQIVIHHDGSKTAEPAPDLQGIHLIPDPVPVQWGDFSQVSMFLHATRWVRDNLSFDWLVMVSGQDYPVQPLERFEARLAGSRYDAFIGHFDGRDAAYWPKNTALHRYYYRYFALPRFAHYYLLPDPIKRAFHTVKGRLNESQPWFFLQTGRPGRPTMMGVRRMNVPFNEHFRCYGGPQWLNVNRKSVDHLHRLVATRPDIVAHYRRTHIPDESFVQSVLVNDPELRICNDACRFVNWDEERQTASPSIITIDELDKVFASGQPFARKFDAAVDDAVLDAIDLRLGIAARRPAAESADR